MKDLKRKVKQGFAKGDFVYLTGWKLNGDHIHLSDDSFTHNTNKYSLWVVDGAPNCGRKAFKTFSGAFNLFIKNVDRDCIDFSRDDGSFFNVTDFDA